MLLFVCFRGIVVFFNWLLGVGRLDVAIIPIFIVIFLKFVKAFIILVIALTQAATEVGALYTDGKEQEDECKVEYPFFDLHNDVIEGYQPLEIIVYIRDLQRFQRKNRSPSENG